MEHVHDPRPLTPPEYRHLAECPRSEDYKPTCECWDLKTEHAGEAGTGPCLIIFCKCNKFMLEKDRCTCEDE